MRVFIRFVLLLSGLVLPACSPASGGPPAQSPPPVVESAPATRRSVITDLEPAACRKEADKTDPNETPYLVCPGVAGYSLIVRRVESGRRSIDLVDPRQHVFPLNYQEFVTRQMSALSNHAEWRVVDRGGRPTPIAVVVGVEAHEDTRAPEKVTRTYLAVAKITATTACVTDRVIAGSRSEAEMQAIVDASAQKACLEAQPPLAGR